MAFTLITQGSFLSAGVPVNVSLQQSCDYFKAVNMTQLATTQGTGRGFQFEWYSNPSFAANNAIMWSKANSANTVNMSLITSGGFNYVTSFPQPGPPVTGSAITNATPAVVTMTNTFNNGDRVVLYNTTGMAQIGGMEFTVSSASGGGFTLAGLPAAGFAAAATNVVARKVSLLNPVVPEFLYVTAVSQDAYGVATVSTDYTISPATIFVGQKLVFQIPSSFGMTQLNTNQLPGTQDLPVIVTAVSGTTVPINGTPTSLSNYQFQFNLNTSAFTAFAFPASTASPTAPLFATVAPAGSSATFNQATQTYTGYNISSGPFRSSLQLPYMQLLAGTLSPAGSSGDTIVWTAWKDESNFYQGV